MPKYVVQYTLPYQHIVRVGIDAEDEEAALDHGLALSESGQLWDDTDEVPLFADYYEEDTWCGHGVDFTVEDKVDVWPERSESEEMSIRYVHAMEAACLLVEAYKRAEEDGGSVEWEDIDAAHELALKATGK